MKLLTIILLLLCYVTALGQEYSAMNEDSINNIFNKLADDTAKVNRLNTTASDIMGLEPLIAINLLHKAQTTATKINYPYGLSVAYGAEARLLFYQVKFDSVLLLINKAYGLIEKQNDIKSISQKASLIHIHANVFQQKQLYDSALIKYQEAIALFTKANDQNRLFFSYYNISGIYNLLNDTGNALFYAKQTLRMSENNKDKNSIMRACMAMADAYAGKKRYDSVYYYAAQGVQVARDINSVFGVGKFYTFFGVYYAQKTKEYDKAITNFKEALFLYESINIWYDIALVKQQLGNVYLLKGDYANATKYLKEADETAKQLGLDQVRLLTLSELVQAEEKQGNINKSYEYLKALTVVKDSLQQRNNRKVVSELETKYQTKEKELSLLSLQQDVKQKKLWLYIVAGTAISLLLISLLSYRTYQQKQKLQQQQIAELEKEKQLLAAEAVLKGQEEERTRLAKDLHDGLGGMLSGIKFSFNTMKENLVLTEENARAYERSMDMLDSSINEMRMVAHNLMPESLVKFGLNTALKDFCDSITGSGVLTVNYHSFGIENQLLDKNKEITIYRIVQELVNNTIKHAGATEAIVQLQKENNLLTVTVEDNGKGFDVSNPSASKGIGLSTIQNRVDYLKGMLHYNSSSGAGTSVRIELTV
jgi:two-component system, NarL family, sensor kinase